MSLADITLVEAKLRSVLPVAYKDFLERYGDAMRFSLAGAESTKTGPDYPEFSKLFGPAELLQANTAQWLTPISSHVTGLSEDVSANVFDYMTAFTTDDGGNFICFPRSRLSNEDLPVFLFDHDLGGVHQVSPSFDEFLLWHVQHVDCQTGDELPLRVPVAFTLENDHNPTYLEKASGAEDSADYSSSRMTSRGDQRTIRYAPPAAESAR